MLSVVWRTRVEWAAPDTPPAASSGGLSLESRDICFELERHFTCTDCLQYACLHLILGHANVFWAMQMQQQAQTAGDKALVDELSSSDKLSVLVQQLLIFEAESLHLILQTATMLYGVLTSNASQTVVSAHAFRSLIIMSASESYCLKAMQCHLILPHWSNFRYDIGWDCKYHLCPPPPCQSAMQGL